MANGRSIATKVSIEGEKAYKSAITSINTALRTLKTEMTAVTATFQGNANSQEALSAKLNTLVNTLAKQREKIEVLNSAIKSGKAAQQQWADQIAKTQARLDENRAAIEKLDTATNGGANQWLAYKRQLDAAEQELQELKNTEGDTTEAQEQLKNKIADLKTKMSELDESTGGVSEEMGRLLEEQEKQTKTMSTQQEGMQKVVDKTERWQAQLNTARAEEASLSAEIDKTNGYLNEAKSASDGCATSIDKMGKEVKEASDEMEESAESVNTVGESFDTLSSIILTAGIANGIKKITDALKTCVDVSADFHYTMATVQAVSGATSEELGQLEQQAKDYASTTVFMAQDVANAYQVMGQAGWTVDEMLDSMAGTMSLASASGEDLGETTNIVVDAMTAFGYSADQAGHFADVLARASADTNTSVALLGNSFQACATTAGGMGYSVDDVAVALGIMANNGLKAETAGTALATALTRMSGANETANAAMEDLGLTMFNTATGQAKPLNQFLGELRESFAGMTEEQKINNAYMLAGQRGMKGLLAIVNASNEDWDKLTDSIADCSGAAKEMSDIQLDTYTGQVKLVESAMEGLQIAVGDQLTPALGELAEGFTNVLSGMTEFVNENEEAVPVITGVVAALATFTTGITVATTAVKVFQLVTSTLGGVINPVAIGVGALSTVLGVATAAFIGGRDEASEWSSAVNEAKKSIEGWEETEATMEASQEKTMGLMQSLISLTGQENKTAAQTAQIKNTVDQLNSSVEGLNLSYDEETDTLNMTTEALENYVRTAMLQTKAEAIVDQMVQLESNRYTIEKQLAEAQEDLAEAQENTNKAVEDGTASYDDMHSREVAAQIKCDELQESLDGVNDSYSSLESQYNSITGEIEEYNQKTEDAEERTGELGDTAEETAEAAETLTEEMQEANDALADVTDKAAEATESGGDLRETYEELEAEFEKYKDTASETAVKTAEVQLAALNLRATNEELLTQYPGLVAGVESLGVPLENLSQWLIGNEITAEEWGEGVNSVKDSIVNGFQELSTDAEISLSEMAENLHSNIQAYQSWDENLEYLMDQAVAANNQGAIDLVNTMRDMGVGYAAQVQAMRDDNTGVFWEMAADMTEAGKTGATGYYNGIEDGKQSITGAWRGISNEGADAAQEGDYEGAGKENAEGLADGVKSKEGTIENAAKEVADAGAKAAEGEKSKYRTAGVNAITQLKNGMLAQKSSVSAAASTIAANAAGQFNSVSWYGIGYNIAAGVANGISANSYLIRNAASNAAQSAYNAAKNALGIHSPSRVMAEIGEYYDKGFAEGITKNISDVTKAANRVAQESATGVYAAKTESTGREKTADGNGNQKLEQILERYLPEIVEKIDSGSGITAKGLAKVLTPYIDSDLGKTERRKSRGN